MHVEVRDPQGAALAAAAELISEANQFRQTFPVGMDGRYVLQDLPFGFYRLSLTAEGFAPWTELVRDTLGSARSNCGDAGPGAGNNAGARE
jgi:hypothetical protein